MSEMARSDRRQRPGAAVADCGRSLGCGRAACGPAVARHRLGRERREPTQPQQVVGGPDEQRVQLGPRTAYEPTLAQTADRLRPAPDFLDQLPPALAQGIAAVAGGPAIEPRSPTAGEERNVGANPAGPDLRNEAPCVIAAIGRERLGADAFAGLAPEQRERPVALGSPRG